MLKHFGFGFSFFFLLLGIVGLIDYLLPEEGLCQAIEVNLPLVFLYFATCIFGFSSLFATENFVRFYFQITGILYGCLTVLGFIYGTHPLLGLFTNNLANTFIHMGIALFALITGFAAKEESSS